MDFKALSRPVLDGEIRFPETEEDRQAVRKQLERLLASSVFRRSRGCSNLLAHIVDRTLLGEGEHLKERNLGVEVFGRASDYDTASDHVVRSTAGEVRKRLAQYYMQPGCSAEIRIEVPPGSYVPRFTIPVHEVDSVELFPVHAPKPRLLARWRMPSLRLRIVALSVTVLSAAAVLALAASFNVAHSSERTLNLFWQPVLQSQNPVLLCIGDWNQVVESGRDGPARPADGAAPQAPPTRAFQGSEKVYLNDSISMAKIAGWLQQNGKAYRIRPQSKVTFADLQAGPAVLLGLRSNYWSTSLADQLRFTVEWGSKPHTLVLRDRKNPSRNNWTVDLSTPFSQTTVDYALVVRALDPRTGQIAITAGGITHIGSLAAGEFLTDPAQISKLDAHAPKGWEHKNIAIVLSTEIIKGSPGPPKIVATDVW